MNWCLHHIIFFVFQCVGSELLFLDPRFKLDLEVMLDAKSTQSAIVLWVPRALNSLAQSI